MLIENLETRRLMSVSLNAATQVLTVTGTDNKDTITVSVVGSQYKVVDNGAIRTAPLSAVKKIVVNAKNGADTVTIAPAVQIPTTIDAGFSGPNYGDGAVYDKVQGGSGPDAITLRGSGSVARGGAGNDRLTNLGYDNALYGEAGNDTLVNDGAFVTTDTLYDGGAGVDTLDSSSNGTGLLLRNGAFGEYIDDSGYPPTLSEVVVDTAAGFENFYGGSGDDFIYGTAGANLLKGNGGNDYIRGAGGNDVIHGGAGENAMFGEDGNDTFYAKNAKKDFLSGGAGTDKGNRDAIDVLNSVAQTF